MLFANICIFFQFSFLIKVFLINNSTSTSKEEHELLSFYALLMSKNN